MIEDDAVKVLAVKERRCAEGSDFPSRLLSIVLLMLKLYKYDLYKKTWLRWVNLIVAAKSLIDLRVFKARTFASLTMPDDIIAWD